MTLDTTRLGEDIRHDIRGRRSSTPRATPPCVAERTVGVDNQPPAAGFFDRATRRFQNPLFDIAAARQLNGVGAASDARLRVYLPVTHTVRVKHGARKGQRRRVTRASAKRTVHFSSGDAARAPSTAAGDSRSPAPRCGPPRAPKAPTGRSPVSRTRPARPAGSRFRLPARAPSREINLVYFPFSDSHEQAVGRPVRLNVRCGVRLSVDRAQRSQRPARALHGRRSRRRCRARGVTASLQVKLGRRYRTFRQVRLRPASDGRFRTTYRFTATARPTRYRFRLLVLKQAGLPYERGSSPTRTVTVTP